VLWLNPDTNWYCDDVGDMLEAVQNDKGAEEAICRYILENNKCSVLKADFDSVYNSAAFWRYQYWLDSVENKYEYLNYPPSALGAMKFRDSVNADTLAHPYDTTVPTLLQDSLETLMGPNASVQQSSPIGSKALLSAQLIENPVSDDGINISYDMGRTALVTMQLSDVLGHSVPIANAKYQLEQPDTHNATIPASNLPSGTYYLRITTDVGDAITLKVVKE
jgi:hypothetical protein